MNAAVNLKKVPAKKAASNVVRLKTTKTETKLFVLDTNVLMHDPTSLFRFEEHDVFLPMVTLEELDNHKKGMSEVARNARQASRFLDEIIGQGGVNAEADIADGISLESPLRKDVTGRLFLQTEAMATTLPANLPQSIVPGKADNQILSVVR